MAGGGGARRPAHARHGGAARPAGARMSLIADHLAEGRQRTLALLAPFDDAFLTAQHSPIMSPLVWDLAHIGNYEDIWLVRALGGTGVAPQHDDLYDAFRHPRRDRPALPLLTPVEARAYIDEVRDRALALADGAARPDDERLLVDDFVYGMVIQHEHQHDETMLATIQLSGVPYAVRNGPRPVREREREMELVAGGVVTIGTSGDRWVYDNERPRHEVELDPFWIDATPVTNAAYAEFVADGGYDDPRHWTVDGWAWRTDTGATAPLFWHDDGTVL